MTLRFDTNRNVKPFLVSEIVLWHDESGRLSLYRRPYHSA